MAENTSNQQQLQASLQDPDTAYDVLYNKVYAPAFFQKLANDYGIQPQTPEEAVQLIKMAGWLRDMHDQQEKTASAGLIAEAAAHLQQHAVHQGVIDPQAQYKQAMAQHVHQVAAQASFDPELAQAVLSLQAAAAN